MTAPEIIPPCMIMIICRLIDLNRYETLEPATDRRQQHQLVCAIGNADDAIGLRRNDRRPDPRQTSDIAEQIEPSHQRPRARASLNALDSGGTS